MALAQPISHNISQLYADSLPEVTRIATEAFATDLFCNIGYPLDSVTRQQLLAEYIGQSFIDSLEQGFCYRAGNEQTGYAVLAFFPPGYDFDLKHWGTFCDAHLAHIPTEQGQTLYLAREHFFDSNRAKCVHAPIAGNNSLWITMIATEKRAEGKGLAGQLLNHILSIADTKGWISSIETNNPRALAWYSRKGFEIKVQAPLPGFNDGSLMYFLLREPAGASTPPISPRDLSELKIAVACAVS